MGTDYNRTDEAKDVFRTKRKPKNEIKFSVQLNEEQKEAKAKILENEIVIITGNAGCLAKGTEVLMFDGTFKAVEDVVEGDKLMGIDSKPRNVLRLCRGKEQMYWIRQNRGDDYRVNESHILSLKRNKPKRHPKITINGKRIVDYSKSVIEEKQLSTVNITVKEYLKLPNKGQYKGYTAPPLNFSESYLPIDPYYLGLWIGDGNKRDIKNLTTTDKEVIQYLKSFGCDLISKKHDNISYYFKEDCIKLNGKFLDLYKLNNISQLKEKYIPECYLINSKENRIKLLCGIIDSDGYYSPKNKYYEITQKNKILSEQIAFLTRSLGYKTKISTKTASMKRKDGSVYYCDVYRVLFSATDLLPVKVERKKNELLSGFKNRSHTGIRVEKDKIDDYYGFELDGDNLFILKDFTVTHNTGKTLVAAQTALDLLFTSEIDKVFVTRPTQQVGSSLGYLPGALEEKLNPYLDPFKDNLYTCYNDKDKIDKYLKDGQIEGTAIQFIRGKTYGQRRMLIIDEAQNTTKVEILALLTRLGKGGRIIVIGDTFQKDISAQLDGLSYAIEMSKKIDGIEWIKMTQNHRSDLVSKILEYEYGK